MAPHEGVPQWVRPDGEMLRLGDGRVIDEGSATYLAPCDPTKILAVHLNYPSRAVEFGASMPDTATYFQKPTTSMNVHRGVLNRPADCQYLNYEGEVAAIVGAPMRNVAPDDTWRYLAGFAPANDVGLHDFRDTDGGGMTRVKGMDGFCPVGPGIVRGVDIRDQRLRTLLNGEVVQEDAVADMTYGIDELLADPQLRQQEGVLRDRLEQLATAHLCPYTGFSSGLDILDCKTLKQLTLSPDEDFESFSFFGDWGWT